jgi:Flp pilus assembly pilin Flp
VANCLRAWIHDERGQDLIEYGLLAAFISVVAVATITSVGGSLQGFWQRIVDVF